MAGWLYRLGTWSARHAWLVIVAWLLVLGGVAGAASALSRPFTTQITVPGTEFQAVVDELEAALPEAAGGSGTVVFSTADRAAFTPAQRAAIAEVIARWESIDQIDTVVDPFATQQQMDDAVTDLAKGKQELADGKKELEENAQKLADGKSDIAEGKQQLEDKAEELEDGARQLEEGQEELDRGKAELETNAAKLAGGEKQLNAGQKKLNQGRSELEANADKLAAGEKQLNAGQQKLDEGRSELEANAATLEAGLAVIKQQEAGLAAGQQQLDAARADLEAKQQHVAGGLAKLAGDITDLEQEIEALIKDQGEDSEAVADARTKLAGLEAQQQELQGQADQLAAGLQALAQQQQELDAGAKQLAQARAEAEAGLQQLQAARAALEASQAEIDANRAELNSGKQQIAAGRAELAAGQAELDANRAKIDDGKQQIAAGRKKLAAGQAEIDANRERINDGRRQIEEARQKLADASAEIADGDVKLAEGRQELLDGEADLARGERQLALTSGLRMVSEAGDVAVSRIQFTEPIEGVSADTKTAITDLGATLAAVGVTVDYSTQISASTFAFGSEGAGLAVAGLILLVMLGSLLAAGLPLITGLVGVGTGLLGVVAATHWVELTEFTPILALMLGLAVGIDYALFLVNRHRHQLVQGTDLVESIGLATGTAGSAVVVAGLTVTVAVGALTLTGIPFLGALGIAAAATVLLTVLVAITLTPALLRLIGHRVLSPKGRRKLAAKQAAAGESQPAASSVLATGAKHDRGWGRFVTRHPIPVMLAATAILGLIAVPAASLRLGLPDGSNEPQDSTAFRAYTLISENFGVGENAAMIAVAKLPEATASALDSDGFTDLQLDIAERLRATPGVAYVVPAMTSDNQQTVVFQIVPTTGPSDDATVDLVNALRDQRDGIIADTGISSLGFAGQTVANIDMSERLAEALPGYLAVVVGISLVLLLLVFRSLLVPLLATGGFLLTIAAAFGAVVAVYQWGWLGTVFQVTHPGPILSFLPTLVIGITFGLAMDYQMFLVTGMRESWAHGEDARTAVRSGFSHGAKVITAAALIMASVFASFVYSHMTVVRPVGFALAIGVLFDAFVVRMTIMPALMHLLGEKAWYLPRWLDRILPNLDVEGTKLLAANHSSAADSSSGTEPPDPA